METVHAAGASSQRLGELAELNIEPVQKTAIESRLVFATGFKGSLQSLPMIMGQYIKHSVASRARDSY